MKLFLLHLLLSRFLTRLNILIDTLFSEIIDRGSSYFLKPNTRTELLHVLKAGHKLVCYMFDTHMAQMLINPFPALVQTKLSNSRLHAIVSPHP
jgi:hypothetical protein